MPKPKKTKVYHSPGIKISFGDGYIKESGESAVYAIIYTQRKKVKFHTGVSVDPIDFDLASGQVLKSHPKASDFNLMINDTKSRLTEILIHYRLQRVQLTPDRIRKEFRNWDRRIDFHQFLDKAIKDRVNEIAYSSIKQHFVLANKLKEYSPDLNFSGIDHDFLSKFNRWLINKYKNSTNTRYNNFKNLKAYLNIAKREGLIKENPLELHMPVKNSYPERYFLTEEQVRDLQALYRKNYLSATDQKILRHFLFMCFTGLRISDLRAIEMDNVVKDLLVFTAYKTRERKPAATKVPLCPFAKQLIHDEGPHRIHGPVFQCFAEQTMRKRIKEIVKVAKIDMDLSLHAGRHTFATMFLRRTKNIAALQKLLGHTKIEMTMIYAHIMTEDIEEEIQNAFATF